MNTCSTSSGHQSHAVLKTFALIYGILFLLVGIAGFVPVLKPDDLLFGYFNVDPLHNVVHIIFGVVGLWTAAGAKASQIYLRLVGIIYTILAVVGFWTEEAPVFGVLSNNIPVAWLHLGLGIIALIVGFCTCCKKCHKN